MDEWLAILQLGPDGERFTLRRLHRMAMARIDYDWLHTSRVMAAAFWSQGGRVNPDQLHPIRAAAVAEEGIEWHCEASEVLIASEIRVEE